MGKFLRLVLTSEGRIRPVWWQNFIAIDQILTKIGFTDFDLMSVDVNRSERVKGATSRGVQMLF